MIPTESNGILSRFLEASISWTLTPQGNDSVEDHVVSRLGLYDLCYEFATGFLEIYHLLKAKALLDPTTSPIFNQLETAISELYKKIVQKEESDQNSNKPAWQIKFSELIVRQATHFISCSEKKAVTNPITLVKEVAISSNKQFDLSQNSALPHHFIRMLNFQKTMKQSDNRLKMGSLTSSAWANYLRCELSNPRGCNKNGIIKSRRLEPLGGIADFFTAELTEVTNAASGILCYLVTVINHSKVFLDELKVTVTCSDGLVYANGEHNILYISQITALSSRKIRLNFKKTSMAPSTITLTLTCSQMNAASDNHKLKLIPLESRPIDLPEKSSLVSPWTIDVSGWRFLVPLALNLLPLAAIKALEELLLFKSAAHKVLIDNETAQLKSLEGYLKGGFTQSLIMVIDAKPKPVYFKESLVDQFSKIYRMMHVERKDMLCYLLFAAVLHGQLVGFKVSIESREGTTSHTFVGSIDCRR